MTGKPYDEYVNRIVNKLCWVHPCFGIQDHLVPGTTPEDMRALLADAWLSGLAYSLNLIEGKKEKRNVQQD
jgi:hypothetical protein